MHYVTGITLSLCALIVVLLVLSTVFMTKNQIRIGKQKSVLFVTAFKDLHRGTWKSSSRSTDEYLNRFGNLQRCKFPLVAFVEDDVAQTLKERFGFTNSFPYDADKTFLGSHLAREQEIMNSDSYKKLVGAQAFLPEHSQPAYTLVMHNKMLFLQRAKDMFPQYNSYAWIDFGYITHEGAIWKTGNLESLGTLSKVLLDTNLPKVIPSQLPNEYDLLRVNPHPLIFRGGMFVVPNVLMDKFVHIYKQLLDEYQRKGLADDEQAVLVMFVKRHPDMFAYVYTDNWFDMLNAIKKGIYVYNK